MKVLVFDPFMFKVGKQAFNLRGFPLSVKSPNNHKLIPALLHRFQEIWGFLLLLSSKTPSNK